MVFKIEEAWEGAIGGLKLKLWAVRSLQFPNDFTVSKYVVWIMCKVNWRIFLMIHTNCIVFTLENFRAKFVIYMFLHDRLKRLLCLNWRMFGKFETQKIIYHFLLNFSYNEFRSDRILVWTWRNSEIENVGKLFIEISLSILFSNLIFT